VDATRHRPVRSLILATVFLAMAGRKQMPGVEIAKAGAESTPTTPAARLDIRPDEAGKNGAATPMTTN
jgi:hypothetical protein